MAELGQAYVQIIPSATGISGSISNVLKPEATSAGTEAGGILGEGCINAATIAIAAGAAAVAAAVAGIVKISSETASYGDTIDKQSQKIGISNKAYQEWSFVLQHCGTNINTMQTAMKTLSKDADKNKDSFEKLGLSMDDVGKMSQEDLFGAVISGLQEMAPGAERNKIASELLGRSYQELAPLLNTSAEATEEMKKKVSDLGGVMSDEAVSNAAGYEDALLDMQTAFNGIKNSLGSQFIPIISTAMEKIALFVGSLSIGDKLKSIGKFLSDMGRTAGSILKPALDALKGAWDSLKIAIEPIIALFSKSNNGMTKVNAGFSAGKIVGTVLASVIRTLSSVFRIVASVISTVVTVVTKVVDVFGKAKAGITSLQDTVKSKASAIYEAISDKFGKAKAKVQPLIDVLKTVKEKFDAFKSAVTHPFKFLSGLKIPKISISGGSVPYGIGGLGTKPSISVKWNAQGGILDKASIIGYGVGEAGKEAIIPLDRFWNELRDSQNDKYSGALYEYFTNGDFIDDIISGMEHVTMKQDGREFGRLVREAVRA